MPVGLKVEAGYESIEGGSAYSNHHHLDFNFTDPKSIFINLNGMNNFEKLAKPNILKLQIDNLDFSLELSGFSLAQRLRVRAVPFEIEE